MSAVIAIFVSWMENFASFVQRRKSAWEGKREKERWKRGILRMERRREGEKKRGKKEGKKRKREKGKKERKRTCTNHINATTNTMVMNQSNKWFW